MVHAATELTGQPYSAALLRQFHFMSRSRPARATSSDSSIKRAVYSDPAKPSCNAVLIDALFIRTCFWYCSVSPHNTTCATAHATIRFCPAANFWFSCKSLCSSRALEATLRAPSTTYLTLLMYFENLITSFLTLPSGYVSNTMTQSPGKDTSSLAKRPTGTTLESGGLSYSVHYDQQYGTLDRQAITRPISFLMEVCSEVRLEEDYTSATTRNSDIPRSSVGNCMVIPWEVHDLSSTNETQDEPVWMRLLDRPTWRFCPVRLNNTESVFPRNPISQSNLLFLSIVMFGDHLYSREFQNHLLNKFLYFKGIVHQSSCAYTPQQNGGDVVLTAAHLIYRMPSRVHLQTSLDCLKESYPSTCLILDVPLRVF
ncbi:Beta-galactosidase [Cucumis melo var. makuwa]|uniref:Beta-galactosidase n=1 Tax=Cucumis melo var. makuwa TaxID=1194695 RepID=A0A5A7UJ47_CUCMM|nr:Beta-galactosidase [Cucumis melo var. makuwa]